MSSPLLLIDVGNSRVKWATSDESTRFSPVADFPTSQLIEDSILKLAARFPGHQAVLSSVVPKFNPYFEEAFQNRLHSVNSTSSALGLLFKYPKPDEIGADRLTAAAAVRDEGAGPAIIVQCGTATAFSVLDSDGYFCGGAIAPGPQTQLAALVGATAQLPDIDLHPSPAILGTSTQEAIRLGVTLGYVGGMNEILRRLCKSGAPPLTTIYLTGGNANFLTDSMEFPFTLRPLLVFEGLRIIGLRAFKDV